MSGGMSGFLQKLPEIAISWAKSCLDSGEGHNEESTKNLVAAFFWMGPLAIFAYAPVHDPSLYAAFLAVLIALAAQPLWAERCRENRKKKEALQSK